MADPVKNFAKAKVKYGYDNSATSIELESGEGAKLPDPATEGAFNLVWWNATDYSDPSDDPYKEIIRVIAKSGDTLTIQRGQEGTSAQNHNISGKVYMVMRVLTAKDYEDLERIKVFKDGILIGERKGLNFINLTDITDNSSQERIDLNFEEFAKDLTFGDGSEGDLIISAGTTTFDLNNKRLFAKKFNNLSITGTGLINFINPHNEGSAVIFYVYDTATITSSATPVIDVSNLGALGAGSAGASGMDAFTMFYNKFFGATGGGGGVQSSTFGGGSGSAGVGIENRVLNSERFSIFKDFVVTAGSGGGAGAQSAPNNPGLGGRGGGVFILIARNINFNGTIYANGANGGNADYNGGGGGGGGGGGSVVILGRNFQSLSGTIQAKGGNGGDGNQNFGTISFGGGGGGACSNNGGQNGVVLIEVSHSLTTNVNAGSNGANVGLGVGGQGGGGGYILIGRI